MFKGEKELPYSVAVSANLKVYIIRRFETRDKALNYCDLIIQISDTTQVTATCKVFKEGQLIHDILNVPFPPAPFDGAENESVCRNPIGRH